MDAPTLQMLTTVAGATLLTSALVQVILNVWRPADATKDRFGPLLAVVVGIAVVEVATFSVITGPASTDFLQGAVNGLFAGLAAMGVHDAVQSAAP